VSIGAALWSFGYGLLGLYWTAGGTGFPFGGSDPDPGIGKGLSVLGGVRQETAAPVVAAGGLVAALVALFAAAALGTLAMFGSVLTFGLIRPWGEVFPRWVPILHGRRVPIPLAIVPAIIVAFLVTSAGLMMTRILLTHPTGENWAAMGPAMLWPLWGIALVVAALAYHYRRRGGCGWCGRPVSRS